MQQDSDSSLQDSFKRAQECLRQLCSKAEGSRRMEIVKGCVQSLVDYQAYLKNLDIECSEYPGVRAQLTDRAFEAESTFRILLAEGLKSLNDIRDSGLLHAQASALANSLDSDEKDIADILDKLGERHPEMPLSLPDDFYAQTLTAIREQEARIGYDDSAQVLILSKRSVGDGGIIKRRFRLLPQAGDLGRIDVDSFFAANGGFAIRPGNPIEVPTDCHHRVTLPYLNGNSTDLYAAALGALASAREAIYHHARKVSEYGHGASVVRANDPITVAVAIAGVAVAVAATVILLNLNIPGLFPPSISLDVNIAFLLFGAAVIVGVIVYIFLL